MTDTDIVTRPEGFSEWFYDRGWLYNNTESGMLEVWNSIAAIVAEQCAKVCDERIGYWQRDDIRRYEDEHCATAIRAKFKA